VDDGGRLNFGSDNLDWTTSVGSQC